MKRLPVLALLAFCGCSFVSGRVLPTHCPEPGPTPAKRINVEPIEMKAFYRQLEVVTRGVSFGELVRMQSGHFDLPMLRVGPLGEEGGRRVLVVAGLHGGEVAATLAGLSVIADVRRDPEAWAGVEVYVILPANPVGFAVQSRWNAIGCDIERDFEEFRTIEAQAIRAVFDRLDPDLLIDLHESDREGVAVSATGGQPQEILDAVVGELAQSAPFPDEPAVEVTGRPWFASGHRLVDYAAAHGAIGLRVETPWKTQDLRARIHAQWIAVRAASRALDGGPGRQ